jgi:hypothetical protein
MWQQCLKDLQNRHSSRQMSRCCSGFALATTRMIDPRNLSICRSRDWGPTAEHRNPVTLDLKWDGASRRFRRDRIGSRGSPYLRSHGIFGDATHT